MVKLNSGVEYRGVNPIFVAFGPGARLWPPRVAVISRPMATAARADAVRPNAGVLACLDPYMNLAMEQTEEYVEGELKNKYGDCFLRGNNGAATLPCP